MCPPGFNDWINEKFPVSPEVKKRNKKLAKWLKEHSKPFTVQPMKIKVVYSVKNLQEIKKIMQEHEIDFDRVYYP
jgi:hypothetical protein